MGPILIPNEVLAKQFSHSHPETQVECLESGMKQSSTNVGFLSFFG